MTETFELFTTVWLTGDINVVDAVRVGDAVMVSRVAWVKGAFVDIVTPFAGRFTSGQLESIAFIAIGTITPETGLFVDALSPNLSSFPINVTSVQYWIRAFLNIRALPSVSIPAGVTSTVVAGAFVFACCIFVTNVE